MRFTVLLFLVLSSCTIPAPIPAPLDGADPERHAARISAPPLRETTTDVSACLTRFEDFHLQVNRGGVRRAPLLAAFESGCRVPDPNRDGQPCTDAALSGGPTGSRDTAKAFAAGCLAAAGVVPRVYTPGEIQAFLLAAVPATSPLVALEPADATSFCPAYLGLDPEDRAGFWRGLIAAMIDPESSRAGDVTLWETGNNPQYSIGLLQLSQTDRAYGCRFRTEADITDPELNIDCGTRILQNRIRRPNGRISGAAPSASEYWHVLKIESGATLRTIQARTRQMEVCRSPA